MQRRVLAATLPPIEVASERLGRRASRLKRGHMLMQAFRIPGGVSKRAHERPEADGRELGEPLVEFEDQEPQAPASEVSSFRL